MNTQIIIKNSEKYARAIKAARGADKALTTLEGAFGLISKYWNNGYDKAAREFGFAKPTDLRRAFMAGKDGTFAPVMFGTGAKGVRVLGVWKSVKQYDMAEEKAVVDAQGRTTHPYLYGADGKPVTADVWKECKRWTPSLIFEVLAQAEYAAMQSAMAEVATEQNIPQENVEYLAQRAIEKVHKANSTAAKEDLQPVLKFEEPAVPAATEAPATETTAAPAPVKAARKSTGKKTARKAAKKATAKAAA